MFSIEEQPAKMHFTSRSEKNGNDRVPAATLTVSYKAPNDVLSEFSPDLKASLYRRPHPGEGDIADNSDTRLEDPHYLPRLKFPDMSNKIAITRQIVGAIVTLHYGVGGKSDLVLDDCKVDDFVFDPQDGGTVDVSLKVDCHPSKDQAGTLHTMQDQEVTISIAPPESPQGELLGS